MSHIALNEMSMVAWKKRNEPKEINLRRWLNCLQIVKYFIVSFSNGVLKTVLQDSLTKMDAFKTPNLSLESNNSILIRSNWIWLTYFRNCRWIEFEFIEDNSKIIWIEFEIDSNLRSRFEVNPKSIRSESEVESKWIRRRFEVDSRFRA